MKLRPRVVSFSFTDDSENPTYYFLKYEDNGKTPLNSKLVRTWRVFISMNLEDWYKIGLTIENPNLKNAKNWYRNIFDNKSEYLKNFSNEYERKSKSDTKST